MQYSFRNEKARDFPEMVHVDISTACNFRCIHCPQGDPGKWVDSSRLMMKNEHFFKVVDEVSRHGGILRITTDGEPLLHPSIKTFLAYVLDSNVSTATITTNGSLLNQEIADLVMKPSKVKLVIDVSIDAIYRRTYERIRRGGNYLTVLRNVLSFVETRNRLKADHVYIMVNAIVQPSVTAEEIRLFENFWGEIADRVITRKYVNVQGLVGNLSGPMDSSPAERWPCLLFWSRIMINPRGQLRFCIDDWNNETVFAGETIDNGSIAEIWQSPTYARFRQGHLTREFSMPLCGPCRNWEGLRWDYDYRVALDSLFAEGQNWGD